MAQSGFTPVLLYASSTAGVSPTAGSLTNSTNGSEIAINIADGKIYYKDPSGVVKFISGGSTAGTVTSVDVSGGSTGLTFSGGPVTSSGTITMAGTLALGYGGTGATTAAGARSNLGAAASGANSDITSLSGLTGAISSPTYVQFGSGSGTTLAAGRMWYDQTTGSLNFGMGGGNITQQVGEELFIYGKASAAITEGQLIVKTGTVGASGVITFGPSPTGLTVNDGIIGVATENIASGSFGRITTYGVVHGIDTTGSSVGETWANNDTLYYNPSYAGGMTNVKPSAPNIKYEIATVINAGPGGSGSIQVLLQPGSTLGGTDSNVQINGSLATNNLIQYNGTYWTNVTPGSVTGVGSVANALSAGTGLSFTSGTTFDGSSARTLNLANTAVTAGSYTNASITVDAQGRLTSASSGTAPVTSVGATAPIQSSGGVTPTISITQASSTTNGYLSSTDWNTFNNKTSNTGTVTSVAMTVPTGLSISGTPITTSGTLALTLTAGYSIPTTASQTNWDSAYTQRLQWDGGSTNLVAATGRTSLGGTTVGQNFFTLTNPTAITFPRINADNTVSALDAATFRTAIGAGTGSGTVTSVTGTSPVVSSGGATPAISLASGYGDTQNPYASKTANYFLAAPNGIAGAPTFRAIVAADIPTLNQNTTGSAGSVANALTIGTGLSGTSYNGSAAVTIALTTTAVTAGSYTNTNITVDAYGRITAASSGSAGGVTSFSGGTTGLTPSTATTGAITLAGTLAIANGGTNATSFNAPASSIAGLIWYDGTRLVNDASTSHVGYNATTHTFYANNVNTSGTFVNAAGIYENAATISTSYSITSGNNGFSAGPVSVANGITVTVPNGSVWVVV